ncbi:hypothetical protein ACFL0M_00475 [Thermodesulfobacteriota bacterium]
MTQLNHLVSGTNPEDVIKEIKYIFSLMATDANHEIFDQIYSDVVSLFNGHYPGYRACNAKYHDLEHTNLVVLAATRLIHGFFPEGRQFVPENFILVFAAALFHDVGLIQAESDLDGSGAKHTIGHEERSVDFMRQYLSEKNFSSQAIEDCSHMIRCTILRLDPNAIPFRNKEIETLGKIVGSADLLGQMADRCYLEKLLLLFEEFEEAGLPGFDSAVDLLQKTEAFFESIAQKRLNQEFDGVATSMRSHFKLRWNLDRDLYAEAISNHIKYLKNLAVICADSYVCYLQNLRRGGIVKSNYEDIAL